MTTTDMISLLERYEFGRSGRPREISLSIAGDDERFIFNPNIMLSSTGGGISGAEICLLVEPIE